MPSDAKKLAAVVQRLECLKREKKEATKEWNAEIKDLEEQAEALAEKVEKS